MYKEFPDTGKLRNELKTALDRYKEEDKEYIDSRIADVFIVGSVPKGDFVPNKSDLDIVVILGNSPHEPICLGFDSYLREDYQSKLIQTANMPINQVDVGVYSANNYHDRIGDEKVYSCKYSRYVPLSDITV